MLEQLGIHMQKKKKKEPQLSLVPYTKINAKLNHRCKFTTHNYKTSRRNHRRKVFFFLIFA